MTKALTPTPLTTAQAVVSMLELNGIDTLYCLPGVQNDSFFDALYDRTNAIRPIHAPFDGDVVFALATGRRPLGADADYVLARLGALAADALARAVARGVFEARPWPDAYVPCWRDLPPA